MLSTVTLGDAKLTVQDRAPARCSGSSSATSSASSLLVAARCSPLIVAIGGIYAVAAADGRHGRRRHCSTLFQSGTLNVALLIVVYLVVLGAFGLLAEIILGFGWWRLLARGATIANPDSLRTVRPPPKTAR